MVVTSCCWRHKNDTQHDLLDFNKTILIFGCDNIRFNLAIYLVLFLLRFFVNNWKDIS